MDLKDQWLALTRTYSSDQNLNLKLFEALNRSYNSSKRFYHTFSHLNDCFKLLEGIKHDVVNQDAFSFAIWYHDVIYNPLRWDNEDRSARVAREELSMINVPERQIDSVSRLILLTKNHGAPTIIDDQDAAYFLDIDLSVFASPQDAYVMYMQSIRKEYSVLPAQVFNPKRANLLKRFLALKHIYHTLHFRQQFEKQARENIQFEIKNLTAQ